MASFGPPIDTVPLFAGERAALLDVLSELDDDDWSLPTVAPGWSVKDVAAHILWVDLNQLSGKRDGHVVEPGPISQTPHDITTFVNGLNAAWLRAAFRLSPRAICDMLAATGPLVQAYFASVDLMAGDGVVTWAGPDQAPVWLDVAREYTERWVHQQQIRDAVRRPASGVRG